MPSSRGAVTTSDGMWQLSFGFPYSATPEQALSDANIHVPDGAVLKTWSAGVYANIAMPVRISIGELAQFAQDVMIHLQHVEHIDDIEMALEFE